MTAPFPIPTLSLVDFYTLKLCGLERKLPIVAISPKIKIASFNLLGDAELVSVAASEMVKRLENITFDYLVGPEVKVVPLLQELSNLLGKKHYIILRKKIHGYMVNPISSPPPLPLVINGSDAALLKNSRVILVDDVISTGKTLAVATKLLTKVGAEIEQGIALLKQGDEPINFDFPLEYLGYLPSFKS